MVKASAYRAVDVGSSPTLVADLFPGQVLPVTYIVLTLLWLPCQAPGVTLSALGLVGPVLMYCDWMR